MQNDTIHATYNLTPTAKCQKKCLCFHNLVLLSLTRLYCLRYELGLMVVTKSVICTHYPSSSIKIVQRHNPIHK